MNKVRFNLGRGNNFMKWKVQNTKTKEVIYYDPDEVSLTLVNCTLHNNKNRAKEIKLGSNKSVCAWVLCDDIIIGPSKEIIGDKIAYNPRVLPYWVNNNEDVDGKFYKELKSNKNALYKI